MFRPNSGFVLALTGLGALGVLCFVGWIVGLADAPMAMHVTISLALLVICICADFAQDRDLPFLMRPGIATASAVVIGSLAAPSLVGGDYSRYLILWVAQVLGVLAGVLLTQDRRARVDARLNRDPRTVLVVNERLIVQIAGAVFVISVLAALIFFVWKGIPALGGNVEQGRVDVAVEGTGYFRLVAYLGIPAAHVLVALRHRYALVVVVTSTLIILGLANRSPLLYLYVPLLLVLFDQQRIRLSSVRILAVAAVVATVILGLGTFRVFSQDEFARYDEFRSDIASRDYVGVALTTFEQYAEVVAENAVLTKDLVDRGALPHQYGTSYLTLFISALPGEQLSLDRQIKQASGKNFVGGGTPPTLMGEGYANFGLLGTVGIGTFVVALLRYWSARYRESVASGDASLRALTAAVYGYMVLWVVGSQVAGLAGASTMPLAGAITLVVMRMLGTRESKVPK